MSDGCHEIRGESGHNGNYIPSGRQLPRTPPPAEVKKRLDFCDDDSNEDCENLEAGNGDQDDGHLNKTFDFITAEIKPEPDDHSMLKGMKGYQLTLGDLEFIQKMKEEKLVKKLEGALDELQRALKKETMAAELVYASRDKAQVELQKFPSCEELAEWVKVVLGTKLPSAEFSDLDAKSLLAMVTEEDVQNVIDKKRTELTQMGKMVENKRKKEAKEKERLEKQIAKEQMKIQGLMSQLSNLKSDIAQQEEASKALETQINRQETPKVKTEIEDVDSSEETQAKYGAKERKKAVKSADKLQDTTNQSKSTRNKLADDQTSGKDHADKGTSETLRTKQKPRAVAEKPAVSGKAARGSQRKVEEKESNPESERAVGAQRKPPGAAQTAASQPKKKGKGKTGEAPASSRQKAAGAAEEAGLRRSKRIASRR